LMKTLMIGCFLIGSLIFFNACTAQGGLTLLPSAATPPGGEGYSDTLTPFQPVEILTNPAGNSSSPQPRSPTSTPLASLWISPAAPKYLARYVRATGLPVTDSYETASLRLEINPQFYPNATDWIYAVVAPFPTVLDGVQLDDLQTAWRGIRSGPLAGQPIWMTSATLNAMASLWGEPAQGAVSVVAADQLVASTWSSRPSWGIVPFEELDPRLKVLSLDGQSPIQRDFDPASYPLKVRFSLVQAMFPPLPSNRDPSQLTILAMTGVTAMVRGTADRMEHHGVLYPGEEVRSVLRAADITHISNEIPFLHGCPTPDPYTSSLRFCSDPRYIALLEDVGTDVVELTGNHMLDYGADPFLYTLDLYKQYNWFTFGGGRDLEDSLQPALITDHGNRLAFLGCNIAGPDSDLATATTPGSTPCEFDALQAEISRLAGLGILPIMTFQYYEYYVPEPTDYEQIDFQGMAQAGAVIVSGSQSHVPAGMEFYGSSFLHYGLGNLFFDQMAHEMPDGSTIYDTRYVMIDRHVFYAGRYLSTELLTYIIEDFARPRLLTAAERKVFLTKIFAATDW
jgi:hypothetical protein